VQRLWTALRQTYEKEHHEAIAGFERLFPASQIDGRSLSPAPMMDSLSTSLYNR